MKKIFLIAFIATTVGFSQEKSLRVEMFLGGAGVSGDFKAETGKTYDSDGFGFGYGISVQYMMTSSFGVGLELTKTGAVVLPVITGLTFDLSTVSITGILAKASYYFTPDKSIQPYLSLGLGLYSIKQPESKVSPTGNISITLIPEASASNFGFSPELGFKMGKFNLAMSYSMAGDMDIDGSTQQYNIMMYKVGYFFDIEL
ncbi:MAG: outer membrane beta-barrel protein [Flavobacteriaceae bacterium]|nr:outer membrane beta-barrel protein [Flavobacteriaceae bacterium]